MRGPRGAPGGPASAGARAGAHWGRRAGRRQGARCSAKAGAGETGERASLRAAGHAAQAADGSALGEDEHTMRNFYERHADLFSERVHALVDEGKCDEAVDVRALPSPAGASARVRGPACA